MIARKHIFRSLRRARYFGPCACMSSHFVETSKFGCSDLRTTIHTCLPSFCENFQDNLRGSPGRKNGANIQRRFLAQAFVEVPSLGESISEGSVKEILKKKGDYVREGEQVITIETDKLTSAVNSTSSGKITEFFVKEDHIVGVGEKLFSVDTDADPPANYEATKKEEKKEDKEPEIKIPKEKPESSKPYSKPEPTVLPPKAEQKPVQQKPEAPKISVFSREQNVVPMTRMRQKIAERLKGVQNETAFLTTFNEVDMSAIIKMREKYGKLFMEKHQIKLGFMGSFMKACSIALMRIPQVNSTLSGKNLIFNNYADISVAVSTEKGLVTPVIRNCESLSIFELEKELMEASKKARNNSLALEDISGGTFTISNGGVFGSLMGTPIINPPQSAILGMHATKKRPVEVDGKIEIRPMMYLALTYDHRVIDGKEAVNFLVNVKNIIEDPVRILLEI